MALKKIVFCILTSIVAASLYAEDKTFVIVCASFNNQNVIVKNLRSIFLQKYSKWRLIYINDNSTDATLDIFNDVVAKSRLSSKITLINNTTRRGHLYNQYHAIHSCKDDEIIVIVDGDDWLAHDGVLSYLNDVYKDPNVWLTYGQFLYYKKERKGICKPVAEDIITKNSYRRDCPWIFSHIRTFYAGLFKAIDKKDLMFEGSFWPMCADVATMLPMLEMTGGRFKYIPDILYIYNDTNPLNIFNNRKEQQRILEAKIRSLPVYSSLSSTSF